MPAADIVIRGAREHNLRNVDLTLPRNQLIVMTGVSGSGKSSLAFDTLYAEGQRRYVESLSTYARQFLGQMPKPEVDAITGLAPSISIQQKATSRNPRSTVGTITEIYDYLRVLFARVGQGHCTRCGQPIAAQSTDQILESIATLAAGTRFQILAPLVNQQKGEFRDLFSDLLKQGYLRARVDGAVVNLSDDLGLKKHFKHTIEVIVDRLIAGKGHRTRLAEAVENAIRLSGGTLLVVVGDNPDSPPDAPGRSTPRASGTESPPVSATQERMYSALYACPDCGVSYEPPSPQLFSFNSPLGMCTDCTGLGMRHEFLLDRLITDDQKSIGKGAIELLGALKQVGRWRRHLLHGGAAAIEKTCHLPEGTVLGDAWADLPEAARQAFLFGLGDVHVTYTWKHSGGTWKHGGKWNGYANELLDEYRKAGNPMRRKQLEKYMDVAVCSGCHGARLNPQARQVRITSISAAAAPSSGNVADNGKARRPAKGNRGATPSGRVPLSLPEVCGLSVAEAAQFFDALDLNDTQRLIAEEAVKEIRGRLGFLLKCGLNYLALDRSAPTLSGGESQRIRLAGQIGCGLVGVLYILDEPSIGLHPRDNAMLLSSLQELRDQGNTVIVVEHDEETMEAADHIVDFGPGPGVRGGEIVVQGTVDDVRGNERSLTGAYLSGRRSIAVPPQRRPTSGPALRIVGAVHNNLKNIDVDIPLGAFVCVTGVSGSGKSSLCNDILWEVLNRDVNQGNGRPGAHRGLDGLEHLDKAIDIDQSPIGRTPRSNPATYVKLFDEIRTLYTQLPQAKLRGYKAGRFSFNVAGGRCEACEGHGATRLEMDFLADIWIPCGVCNGQRFNHETLEVRYKDKSIAGVLDMDVQEALEHFQHHPKIHRMLQTLHDVGLDYMKLGQPSPTLSGGEAQRIKLARELGKRSTGRTLYLLDEPTTGLHFADVHKLLDVLHGFVAAGNSVIVVEHSLDVVKTADWVIDLGPEGGSGGGEVLVTGTPEEVSRCDRSHTGRALRNVLKPAPSTRKKGTNGAGQRRGANLRPDPDSLAPRDAITIRGAAQHNLQSIDVSIPRDRISVFCGPSGSGKTSLAMDTLYAEGQRRYVESLSAYARQFLGQMPKPKVEHVHGLSPAIAIEQKTVGATPRSTVGTVTEIYDYLRILFARLGQPHCPDCHHPVARQTTDEIIERIMALPEGTRLYLAAPVSIPVGQSYAKLWDRLGTQGFLRVRINGVTYSIEDVPRIDHKREHTVEAIVDRVKVSPDGRGRIADSIEAALDLGKGVVHLVHTDAAIPEASWRVDRLSLHFSCPTCNRAFVDLSPQNFSFNSPLGWCSACEGLGSEMGTNQAALIASPQSTLAGGAVSAWPDPRTNPPFALVLSALAAAFGIPLDRPWYQLDPLHQRIVLYGSDQWIDVAPVASGKSAKTPPLPAFRFQYKGLYPAIEEASHVSYDYRLRLQNLVGEQDCSLCHGDRIRDDAAAVRLKGLTLPHLCRLPLNETLAFLNGLKLSREQKKVAGDLLAEATHRLTFLVDVGLHYLTLNRSMPSLSGGESQRIRLAGQIGRALTGVLYVLDEPTIGLHPRDNGRLIQALHRLRDLGNTVVLVEHDREVLEAADRLYDFGPGAGRFGGSIVAEGAPREIIAHPDGSLTGQYLSGAKGIPVPRVRRMTRLESGAPVPARRRSKRGSAPEPTAELSAPVFQTSDFAPPPGGAWLEITRCRQNNLRGVDLRIPLGALTCVTGLSGSGKSSLVMETLARAVARHLHRQGEAPGPFDELRGVEHVSRVIVVDQQPIGATPASNPATYVGVFDPIRELFSRLPDSKIRGYKPGRFSFNRAGGRCEDCEGLGQKRIEMHFLPDVWVTCDTCRGKRYHQETLQVRFRGQSIADVLDLSIGQALALFENIPKIRAPLATLCAIGLDYLTLGQAAPTLSGGEAQRVKLAAELAKPQSGKTLYLLDEPTTGLHFDDIAKLLKVLGSLVEQGNTIVVIEHNLDVVKTADWIIDVGPEAGVDGGRIVAEGTPEDVVAQAAAWRQQSSAGPDGTAPRREPGRKRGRQNNLSSPDPAAGLPGESSPSAPARSWTGELLAPILAEQARGEIEIFDARAVAKKRSGDIDIARVGRDAALPWQVDGRKWHTADRVSRSGKNCKWEGAALALVVDQLETYKGLKAPNWNDPASVEVTAEKKAGAGWFFHALTGDEWLLRLYFRVPKKTFDSESLVRALALQPVNELDEIPVYNRGERVKVNTAKGPFQEVVIDVHWKREIDTPAFRTFLDQAAAAYLGRVEQAVAAPDEIMPWKVLGRKWHLSRKGFPSNKRVQWPAAVLESIIGQLEELLPDAAADWTNKQVVYFTRPGSETPLVELHTKRREGVDLALLAEPGTFALGRVADFGAQRELTNHRSGREALKFRFDAVEQTTARDFRDFLRKFAAP